MNQIVDRSLVDEYVDEINKINLSIKDAKIKMSNVKI